MSEIPRYVLRSFTVSLSPSYRSERGLFAFRRWIRFEQRRRTHRRPCVFCACTDTRCVCVCGQLKEGRDRPHSALRGARPRQASLASLRAPQSDLCRVRSCSQDPAMLLRETLGISADGSEKMYRDDDVTAFEQRQAERMVWIDRDHRCDLFVLWVLTRGRAPDGLSICVCVSLFRLNVMHFFVAVPLATRSNHVHSVPMTHVAQLSQRRLTRRAAARARFRSARRSRCRTGRSRCVRTLRHQSRLDRGFGVGGGG